MLPVRQAGQAILTGTGAGLGTGSNSTTYMLTNLTAAIVFVGILPGITPTTAVPNPTQPSLPVNTGFPVPPGTTLVEFPNASGYAFPVVAANGVVTATPVLITSPK